MTKEQKKAADKLLDATQGALRHISYAFGQAHDHLHPLSKSVQSLVDLHPTASLSSSRLKELVDALEQEVMLQQTELLALEENLFPGRRAKYEAQAQANLHDQRTATMEKYAGYTGE